MFIHMYEGVSPEKRYESHENHRTVLYGMAV